MVTFWPRDLLSVQILSVQFDPRYRIIFSGIHTSDQSAGQNNWNAEPVASILPVQTLSVCDVDRILPSPVHDGPSGARSWKPPREACPTASGRTAVSLKRLLACNVTTMFLEGKYDTYKRRTIVPVWMWNINLAWNLAASRWSSCSFSTDSCHFWCRSPTRFSIWKSTKYNFLL